MDPETDSWRPSTSRADPLSERARPPYRLRDRAVDQPRGGELEGDGAVVVSVAVVVEPECARRAFAKPDIPHSSSRAASSGSARWCARIRARRLIASLPTSKPIT
jgi:hypothetical protein